MTEKAMSKFWIVIVLLVIIMIGGIVLGRKSEVPPVQEDPEVTLAYFTDTITAEVKAKNPDYEQLGLAGGVDGMILAKTFPNLRPEDFNGVVAYQGEYLIEDGELVFSGNAASDSAVLQKEGMRKLLDNCSARLGIEVNSKADIDEILRRLRG